MTRSPLPMAALILGLLAILGPAAIAAQEVVTSMSPKVPMNRIGGRLTGDFSAFRAYSLCDLRRPAEGARDLRTDETLYRVDTDNMTIRRIYRLPQIVLN